MGGFLREVTSLHDGSMEKARLTAWTIIQEEPGWLKALLQGMRKMAGCPGKHRKEGPDSKKLTPRFAGYSQNAVNSDNTEDSSYERGRPGGDGKVPRKRKNKIRSTEERKIFCSLILSLLKRPLGDENLAMSSFNYMRLTGASKYDLGHSPCGMF